MSNCTCDRTQAGNCISRLGKLTALKRLHERINIGVYIFSSIFPNVGNGCHQLQKGRLREIGAAKEWLCIGSHEYGHRPSTAPRHGLNGFHVHRVYVGAFFTIYFYVDKQSVHLSCNIDVFKTFVGHDMAPVTS